jgi:hypothetical protein
MHSWRIKTLLGIIWYFILVFMGSMYSSIIVNLDPDWWLTGYPFIRIRKKDYAVLYGRFPIKFWGWGPIKNFFNNRLLRCRFKVSRWKTGVLSVLSYLFFKKSYLSLSMFVCLLQCVPQGRVYLRIILAQYYKVSIIIPSTRSALPPGLSQNPRGIQSQYWLHL